MALLIKKKICGLPTNRKILVMSCCYSNF